MRKGKEEVIREGEVGKARANKEMGKSRRNERNGSRGNEQKLWKGEYGKIREGK